MDRTPHIGPRDALYGGTRYGSFTRRPPTPDSAGSGNHRLPKPDCRLPLLEHHRQRNRGLFERVFRLVDGRVSVAVGAAHAVIAALPLRQSCQGHLVPLGVERLARIVEVEARLRPILYSTDSPLVRDPGYPRTDGGYPADLRRDLVSVTGMEIANTMIIANPRASPRVFIMAPGISERDRHGRTP